MPTPMKPPEQRQRRNKPKNLAALVPQPRGEVQEVPDPPTDLNEQQREEWHSLWATELAQRTYDLRSDRAALERLFRLRSEVAALENMVTKSNSWLVKSPTGQLTRNPLTRQIAELRGEILALEDRFGLSPQARLKLGIALGDAHRSLDDLNSRIAKEVAHNNDNSDDPGSEDDPRLNVVDIQG